MKSQWNWVWGVVLVAGLNFYFNTDSHRRDAVRFVAFQPKVSPS